MSGKFRSKENPENLLLGDINKKTNVPYDVRLVPRSSHGESLSHFSAKSVHAAGTNVFINEFKDDLLKIFRNQDQLLSDFLHTIKTTDYKEHARKHPDKNTSFELQEAIINMICFAQASLVFHTRTFDQYPVIDVNQDSLSMADAIFGSCFRDFKKYLQDEKENSASELKMKKKVKSFMFPSISNEKQYELSGLSTSTLQLFAGQNIEEPFDWRYDFYSQKNYDEEWKKNVEKTVAEKDDAVLVQTYFSFLSFVEAAYSKLHNEKSIALQQSHAKDPQIPTAYGRILNSVTDENCSIMMLINSILCKAMACIRIGWAIQTQTWKKYYYEMAMPYNSPKSVYLEKLFFTCSTI